MSAGSEKVSGTFSNRASEGGLICHVLNRANARTTIFENDDDNAAFERLLEAAVQRMKIRVLAFCIMPNHWHLIGWPREDGELSRFVVWLTPPHTQRWQVHRRSTGSGHACLGRFKPFPAQVGSHFYTVCRHVERNALHAGLVRRAARGALAMT